jgi:RNA polymerase sigma-70 factor (ECF subfamily)
MKEEEKDPIQNASDEELLGRAKDGEKLAFDVFYSRNKRRILNYVYRMISNRARAEEVTQEVFVKAYLALESYSEEGKALNWIYTIAGNLSKNYLRDKRYEPGLLLDKELRGQDGITLGDVIPSDSDTPLEITLKKEQELLVQINIDKLPVKYKEILILCDIQGHSYEEVAEILNCSTGSVGSRLSKARSLLAKSLKKYFKQNDSDEETSE